MAAAYHARVVEDAIHEIPFPSTKKCGGVVKQRWWIVDISIDIPHNFSRAVPSGNTKEKNWST